MENEVRSTVEMFGLTKQQIKILYSLEYLLTKRDINSNQKDIIYKEHWLEHWSACLQATMDDEITFYTYEELLDTVANEASSRWERQKTRISTIRNCITPIRRRF